MWNDEERALVDAWQDWRNSLHKCGRLRSESMRIPGMPDPPAYGFIKWECAGCEADERERARLSKAVSKADQEAGVNPAAWVDLQLVTAEEMAQFEAAPHDN